MNILSGEKLKSVNILLLGGCSARQIRQQVGISTNTAIKYRKILLNSGIKLICGCGGTAGHKGWCKFRYANSPARQAWQASRPPARPRVYAPKIPLTTDHWNKFKRELQGEPEYISQITALLPGWYNPGAKMDICMDMVADILEGKLDPGDIQTQMRRYISSHYGSFNGQFNRKTISIHQPIRGQPDLTIEGTLGCEPGQQLFFEENNQPNFR